MNFLQAHSKNFGSSKLGIEGEERELIRAKLDVAKAVQVYAKRRQGNHKNNSEWLATVDSELNLNSGAAMEYCTIVMHYINPVAKEWVPFPFSFLCGAGLPKLLAFAPHLRSYYAKPDGVFRDRIWLTIWSIEILIPNQNGGSAWWDLRELTVEQIKDLENLLRTGLVAGSVNSALPAPAGQFAPPNQHPQDAPQDTPALAAIEDTDPTWDEIATDFAMGNSDYGEM